MKELFNKRKEYLIKSKALRNMDHKYLSYEQSRAIHKEQDEYYRKWLFFKKLDNAIRSIDNVKN